MTYYYSTKLKSKHLSLLVKRLRNLAPNCISSLIPLNSPLSILQSNQTICSFLLCIGWTSIVFSAYLKVTILLHPMEAEPFHSLNPSTSGAGTLLPGVGTWFTPGDDTSGHRDQFKNGHVTPSKPEMQRLLLALLGKRRSALWSCMDVGAELLLLFCCHRTRTYLRMESSLREVEPGDEVQELRTREPFCTPGQLLSGAAWCPGFFNYWGNKLCVYIRIFTTESVLNEIVPFIAQLSLSPFPFFLQRPKPLIP